MVKTPSNVSTMHKDFASIVNFEIIPKEALYDWVVVPVLGVSSSEELFMQEVQDDVSDLSSALGDPAYANQIGNDGSDESFVPPSEEETSIDSSLKGSNMLMNSLLVILLLAFIMLIIGLIWVCRKYIIPRCCSCGKSCCRILANKLMFNSVIRGLLESYFPLSIATVYQLSQDKWEDGDVLHQILAIITIIYLVIFPIFSLWFVLRYFKILSTPRMLNKYGSFYQNVDPTRKVALRFTFYFCLRRLVFAMVICLVTNSLVVQVMIADFTILALLSFYSRIRPMKNELNNGVQIFNEVAILILLQWMFMLTDFTVNPEIRHDYGYYFLYYVATLIGINLCVLFVSIYFDVRRACRRHYARKRAREAKKRPGIAEIARVLSSIVDSSSSSDEAEEESAPNSAKKTQAELNDGHESAL